MSGDNKPALVALRRRRDEVIEALSDHFASDALTLEEFEERLELAHRATALEHFDPLLGDLEAPPAKASSQAMVVARPAPAALDRPEEKRLTSVLASVRREGQWRVPAKLRVRSVLGEATVDFREVALPAGVTEVDALAVLGSVLIIVPPTLAVECEGSALLGDIVEMNRSPVERDPDSPLLIISARAVLGELRIETRLPGESARRARKRLRKAKKLARAKALSDGRSR